MNPAGASLRWRAWPSWALVGGAVALAAIGALVAANLLAQRATAGAPPSRSSHVYAVGGSVPTSFGALTVRDAQKIVGLTAQDLSGVTHGIQNLVPPDKVQVEASLMLTNRLDHPVDYSLAEQFWLVTGSGAQAERLPGLTAQPSKLPAHSSITANVRFIAPRDGGDLWLAFSDPGRAEPLFVALGPTDQAPAGVLDGYHEHDGKAPP